MKLALVHLPLYLGSISTAWPNEDYSDSIRFVFNHHHIVPSSNAIVRALGSCGHEAINWNPLYEEAYIYHMSNTRCFIQQIKMHWTETFCFCNHSWRGHCRVVQWSTLVRYPDYPVTSYSKSTRAWTLVPTKLICIQSYLLSV